MSNPLDLINKSSAVAKMGDRLATVDARALYHTS